MNPTKSTWCSVTGPATAVPSPTRSHPLPEVGAGVAYVRLETSPDPVRVRAGHVTDADIHDMAAPGQGGR